VLTVTVASPASRIATEGYIIIAQIANLGNPFVLTELLPVCPATAGTLASISPMSFEWPLASAGDGAASSIAFYGKVNSTGGGSAADCVIPLSTLVSFTLLIRDQQQAMYLLGRSLEWREL
jgi:hypothetical protein